jgi:hypothetical protein
MVLKSQLKPNVRGICRMFSIAAFNMAALIDGSYTKPALASKRFRIVRSTLSALVSNRWVIFLTTVCSNECERDKGCIVLPLICSQWSFPVSYHFCQICVAAITLFSLHDCLETVFFHVPFRYPACSRSSTEQWNLL